MKKFSGLDYLKIDIANHLGLDKQSWDDRIKYIDQHEHELERMIEQAEEPALFYASVKAYRKAQRKEPSGYPISLDATASGSQILACLTCDPQAAELCNVISTGKREDVYTNIYHKMLEKLGGSEKIERDQVKKAVMTSLYGSQAVPKNVFGAGSLYATFLETMNEMMPYAWELNQACLDLWNPKAFSYDWIMPDNFHVHVKVMQPEKEVIHFMDAPYEISYMVNKPTKEGRSISANMVHSIDGLIVREMQRRCNYNPKTVETVKSALEYALQNTKTYQQNKDKNSPHLMMLNTLLDLAKKTGYLSARILDYVRLETVGFMDLYQVQSVYELIQSMPKKPFEIITIHDCFRVLPNYGNDIRQQYNNQLMLIAKSNLLEYLLTQITGREIKINKADPELYKKIYITEYALS